MTADSIKIPQTLYRKCEVRKGTVDKETRTVPMSFSSETPVRRTTETGDIYNEILDHATDSVIIGRLASGSAPLLMHHDPKDQVGVVDSARLDGKVGRCQVRFSSSTRGQEIMKDVDEGIRGATSVGYQVHSMDQDEDDPEDDEGVPNYRCRWEPIEVSLESIPADHTVGANRNLQTQPQISVPIKRKAPKIMITQTRSRQLTADGAGGNGISLTPEEIQTRVDETVKKDRLRVADILGYAKQYERKDSPGEFAEQARAYVADPAKTADDFLKIIIEKRTNAKPIPAAAMHDGIIGMNDRETQQFSILKAIRELSDNKGRGSLSGLEKEASEAALKRSGRGLEGPLGFCIPEDVVRSKFRGEGWQRKAMTRDMQAGVFSQGGAFVETEVLGSSLIELLRNKMQVVNAGATTMAGLRNNVAIPRQTAASTAYWLSEISAVSESDQTLQQLLLTPHRLAATTNYSNLLLAQATLDAEAFVRMDLMKQLALAKDLAAYSGSGGAQPIGIFNTTGVGTTSWTSGAPTWAQAVGFETTVAAANADFGALAYIVSAQGRGILKQTPKISSSAFPIYIWEAPIDASKSSEGEGTINGYRALATNQLNTALNGNKSVFGNWEDLVIADWEGWQVIVDPYTLATQQEIRIVIFNFTDIGIRHPGSFCYSTNSLV
jgi:HK97 family phage major capsid protein